MPKLQNPRHEIAAREYVRTGVRAKAYRRAFNCDGWKPESVWSKASALFAMDKVAKRVTELQEQAAQRAVVSVESLCLELDQAREGALDVDQFSAAVSATMGKAKITGKIVDRLALDRQQAQADAAAHQVEELDPEQRSRYDLARRIAWALANGRRLLEGPKSTVIDQE